MKGFANAIIQTKNFIAAAAANKNINLTFKENVNLGFVVPIGIPISKPFKSNEHMLHYYFAC